MLTTGHFPRCADALAGVPALFFAAVMLLAGGLQAAPEIWSRDDAAHLLRRAGFGGTPSQIERTWALGRDGAVDYLITGKLPAGAEAPFPHVTFTPFAVKPNIE